MYGGELIAEVLRSQGVETIFTLCGGHISPILVAAQERNIKVIDTRHEATAVFAADAWSRLSSVPGVAVVTAGPGATNTLTAVKNAQLAHSPVIIISGAPATALKGHGALQDVDLVTLFKPVVKWCATVTKVKDLVPLIEKAFLVSQSDAPGPVFLECPADLLYEESLVRKAYGLENSAKSLKGKVIGYYLKRHVDSLFKNTENPRISRRISSSKMLPDSQQLSRVAEQLARAKQPLLLLGNQVVMNTETIQKTKTAIEMLGIPVYLTGMARGLLGDRHNLLMRHKRKEALKEADLVILAGVPCDFRLNYGKHIGRNAVLISVNRSIEDLRLNCRPKVAMKCDPALFLMKLAKNLRSTAQREPWIQDLRQNDIARNKEIEQQSAIESPNINPLALFKELNSLKQPNSIFIADGGDFVSTASYILDPPKPMSWLDPGPFGTLGVGAGFALSAKLLHHDSEIWIIYGDGALGYSLMEFDTFVRHGIPIIALVGNDAGWTQVSRDQIDIFKNDVGTVLTHTDYHKVAEGLGGIGLYVDEQSAVKDVLIQAQRFAAEGRAVLINAILSKSEFRKGSMSM